MLVVARFSIRAFSQEETVECCAAIPENVPENANALLYKSFQFEMHCI